MSSGKVPLVAHNHNPAQRSRRRPHRVRRAYPFLQPIFRNEPCSFKKKKKKDNENRAIKKLSSTFLIEAARERRVLESLIGAKRVKRHDTHAALLDEKDRHAALEIQVLVLSVYKDFHKPTIRLLSNNPNGVVLERLKKKLLEAEEREKRATKRLEKLRLDLERLVEEDKAKDRKIEELKKHYMDLASKVADEPCNLINKIQMDLQQAILDRNESASMCNKTQQRMESLQSEKRHLDSSIFHSTIKIKGMRNTIIPVIEDSLAEAVADGKDMEMKLRALVQEEEEMRKKIEVVSKRNVRAHLDLGLLLMEPQFQRKEIAITNSAFVLTPLDSEIEQMQTEVVDPLRGTAVTEFEMMKQQQQQQQQQEEQEPLHKFAAGAHKKNNGLWILTISATVIFAAALLAKGR